MKRQTVIFISLIFLMLSCTRLDYNGVIAVELHLWELKRIDTFYTAGRYRPSATWYNTYDRLFYVDNDHEFPYPYMVGCHMNNFDRK